MASNDASRARINGLIGLGSPLHRLSRIARVAAALPPIFICTLYDPVSDSYVNTPSGQPIPAATIEAATAPAFSTLSIGGGPAGGVDGSTTFATPTDYGDCGPGARPETGLQGAVPIADQRSGASKDGYRCNLRLVGQNTILDRGANFQMGYYRHCAYVGSVGVRDYQSAGDDLDGVAVIDASNPTEPKLAEIVRAPSGISQHEAVEVNKERGMLVVETGGLLARYIDVYDVSQDCTKPIFKGRYDAGKPIFHGMRISEDGKTIYATDFTGAFALTGEVMHVIDVTEMSNPHAILKWSPIDEQPSQIYGIHDLELSPDGNRAYLGAVDPSANLGALVVGGPSNTGPTMVVLDTSDIQARKPNPDLRVISDVQLANWGHAEQRATIDGKPYIFTSGETPFGGAKNCPWAWGNVIEISDETKPKVISEIKLEVNEQSNCGAAGADDAVYSIHYVGVDDEEKTTMVFYTYYTGGVRVFDVRDPQNPVEIAYFHPQPLADVAHDPLPINGGDTQRPAWDSATSIVRYLPKQRRLWFVSIAGGFQVLELTTPEPEGKARLLGQTAREALDRNAVAARARCSLACEIDLTLKVAGRRSDRRSVRFAAKGEKELQLRLDRTAARALARRPSARIQIRGIVRDPDTGRRIHAFGTKPRKLTRFAAPHA